jgi:hypothetical protein
MRSFWRLFLRLLFVSLQVLSFTLKALLFCVALALALFYPTLGIVYLAKRRPRSYRRQR